MSGAPKVIGLTESQQEILLPRCLHAEKLRLMKTGDVAVIYPFDTAQKSQWKEIECATLKIAVSELKRKIEIPVKSSDFDLIVREAGHSGFRVPGNVLHAFEQEAMSTKHAPPPSAGWTPGLFKPQPATTETKPTVGPTPHTTDTGPHSGG